MDGRTCNIAILAADGFSAADVAQARSALGHSAHALVVATHLGVLDGDDGSQLPVDVRLLKVSASDFDGVFIPGGDAHVDALAREPQAAQFLSSAIGRGRVVAAAGSGRLLLSMIRGDGSSGSGGRRAGG
jgi:putative intracellular protease/amidase